ncbi:hypothetical protein HID58_045761 [Brassica napus]|uniref:Alanyl-tRNA synthetase class IIc N-terminal domain-containing protein n=1 Tax=Brassica napus TaxID=3708 RepID=A0ABQ8AUN6_BRANA|nr:hypothetical protein HID58_045761 [Brassica napus]
MSFTRASLFDFPLLKPLVLSHHSSVFASRRFVTKPILSLSPAVLLPTRPTQIIAKSSSVTAQPVSEDASEKDHQSKDVSGDSIRRRFLDFYASRGHKVLPSASLVPEDPTVLLTIAGMLQFKPVFLGKVSIIIQFHRCFETVS